MDRLLDCWELESELVVPSPSAIAACAFRKSEASQPCWEGAGCTDHPLSLIRLGCSCANSDIPNPAIFPPFSTTRSSLPTLPSYDTFAPLLQPPIFPKLAQYSHHGNRRRKRADGSNRPTSGSVLRTSNGAKRRVLTLPPCRPDQPSQEPEPAAQPPAKRRLPAPVSVSLGPPRPRRTRPSHR